MKQRTKILGLVGIGLLGFGIFLAYTPREKEKLPNMRKIPKTVKVREDEVPTRAFTPPTSSSSVPAGPETDQSVSVRQESYAVSDSEGKPSSPSVKEESQAAASQAQASSTPSGQTAQSANVSSQSSALSSAPIKSSEGTKDYTVIVRDQKDQLVEINTFTSQVEAEAWGQERAAQASGNDRMASVTVKEVKK